MKADNFPEPAVAIRLERLGGSTGQAQIAAAADISAAIRILSGAGSPGQRPLAKPGYRSDAFCPQPAGRPFGPEICPIIGGVINALGPGLRENERDMFWPIVSRLAKSSAGRDSEAARIYRINDWLLREALPTAVEPTLGVSASLILRRLAPLDLSEYDLAVSGPELELEEERTRRSFSAIDQIGRMRKRMISRSGPTALELPIYNAALLVEDACEVANRYNIYPGDTEKRSAEATKVVNLFAVCVGSALSFIIDELDKDCSRRSEIVALTVSLVDSLLPAPE